VRSFHLAREFSRHADVTVVSFHDREATSVDIDPLLEFCSRIEVVQLSPRRSRINMALNLRERVPFQVAYYRSQVMDRLVERLRRERFDLVFAQLFRLFPYLDRFERSMRVIDLTDSLSLNLRRAIPVKPAWKRPAFREEQRRVNRYEAMVLDRVKEGWVVSEVDRADLAARNPAAHLEIIPNGVALHWGQAGLDGPKDDAVLFLGNLTVGHNIDTVRHLAEDVWPIVRKRRPEARLDVVGAAGPAVRSLARLPGVRLHGFVEDLTPLLRSARVGAAPLRYGAGLQNKAVELMSAGLPVVVTPIVAGPIGAEPGREIMIGESPESLADRIVTLMEDESLARTMGVAGSAFVRSRLTWDVAGRRMAALLA